MPPPNLKSKTAQSCKAAQSAVPANGNAASAIGKPAAPLDPSERRGFLGKFAAVVIGGLVTIFPFAAGLLVFADPLRRKSEAKGFLKVATLDSIPDDGVPRAFQVVSDRTDAWTYYPSQPIGAVFLRRKKGEKTPIAFQTTCPHAGCRIDFVSSDQLFKCPCHNSCFDLNGDIRQPSPSPRPMDQLACRVEDNHGLAEVWVDFQDFYTGMTQKIAKT